MQTKQDEQQVRWDKIWDEQRVSSSSVDSIHKHCTDIFLMFYEKYGVKKTNINGLDIGCGTGLNSLIIADSNIHMTGIDFSPAAIKKAESESKKKDTTSNVRFAMHDITKPYPFDPESFDFVLDIFTTSEVIGLSTREQVLANNLRVLKKGGLIFFYLLSDEDNFFKDNTGRYPGSEKNSARIAGFGPQTKGFTEKELRDYYKKPDLEIKSLEHKKMSFVLREREYTQDCYYGIAQKI